MKRLVQNGWIGIFVIALFLAIQSKIALGADVKTDGLKFDPIYSNGYVVYQPIGLPQLNTNSSARLQDAAGPITFTIQDPNHLETSVGTLFKSKIDLSTNYYYSRLSPTVTKTQTVAGLQIQVNNLDWSKTNTIYAFITTSKYAFEVKLTQSQAGTTIALAPDDSFTTVDAKINYAGSGLSVQGTQVNYTDENGKGIGSVYITSQKMIKTGTYDFITMANDNSHAYYLSKPNFQLSKENHTLNFDKQDAGLISLTMHDLSTNGMRIESFYAARENFNEYYYSNIPSGINTIYISKLHYQEFGVCCVSSTSNWRYYYDTSKDINIQDDSTQLDFGTRFKVQLQNSGAIYGKGQYFWDLFICDEYYNRLYSVWGPNYTTLSGLVELTDSNGVKTNPSISSACGPYFQLPNVTGTYTLTYSVTGGLFSITPLPPTKITVSENGGGPPQSLGTPSNLKTTFVSGSEVDLSWDYYYYNDGSTLLNIYRSTKSDGPFTLIGSTVSSAYFDRNVSPMTNYWYYVTASNTVSEGMPSDKINVLTTSNITNDNSVGFSIQDPNHELTLNQNELNQLFWKVVNSDNSYRYYNMYYGNPFISKTETGWVIKYNGIDWRIANQYYIPIKTSKYLFVATIDRSKEGTITPLAVDNTYTQLQVSIPFAVGSLNIQGIQVNYLDSNGVTMATSLVQPGTLVPAGNADLLVLGTDDNNGFYLNKRSFSINKTNNVLSFAKADAGLVKINLTNPSGMTMNTSYFTAYDNSFSFWYGVSLFVNSKSHNFVYVTKQNYDSFGVNFYEQSLKCQFRVDSNIPINVQDDSTVLNFDTNFKCNISLYKQTYSPGEYINKLNIVDGYNNYLGNLYGNNVSSASGKVEFINSSGDTVATIPLNNNSCWPNIQAPNIEGTFTLKYSVTCAPLTITPATTSITISNSAVQVPGTPTNLRTIVVGSDGVALTWDKEYGATFYNVYRATGNDGTFDLIGSSNANFYSDSTVMPNTTYKYYVTAANSAGEGQPSQQIIVKTLNNSNFIIGDVDRNGTIDSNDYGLIKLYILGIKTFSTASFTAADVDGDGKITSKDYALVKKYLLNEIIVFPAQR